jgi:WD40 repeat protein
MVQVWSVPGWELMDEHEIGTPAVNGMAFSHDGRWLAVGAADRRIRLFSLEKSP